MMGEAQGYTKEKNSAALKTEQQGRQTSTRPLHHSGSLTQGLGRRWCPAKASGRSNTWTESGRRSRCSLGQERRNIFQRQQHMQTQENERENGASGDPNVIQVSTACG